jgi:hypothetical protein
MRNFTLRKTYSPEGTLSAQVDRSQSSTTTDYGDGSASAGTARLRRRPGLEPAGSFGQGPARPAISRRDLGPIVPEMRRS